MPKNSSPAKASTKKCEFVACSGENGKIDRIESECLIPLLRMEIGEISELAGELKDALDTYTKQLNKIAYVENNEHLLRGFQIINFKNSTTNYDFLKGQVEMVILEAEKFAGFVKGNFVAEEHSLKFAYVDYYGLNDPKYIPFKLRYVKLDLVKIKQAAANVELKNTTECYGMELNCAIYSMGFYVIERLYCLTILLLSVQSSRYVIAF